MDRHLPALHALHAEYLGWVGAQMAEHLGRPAQDRADGADGDANADAGAAVLAQLCGQAPPEGVFYLLHQQGQLAGMGGLRRLDAGVAEIKRLYLRPAFRGQGAGDALVARLLQDAAAFGYQRLCLDSAPFMHAAHRLYRRHGFSDCPPYPGTEVAPQLWGPWRFMARALGQV